MGRTFTSKAFTNASVFNPGRRVSQFCGGSWLLDKFPWAGYYHGKQNISLAEREIECPCCKACKQSQKARQLEDVQNKHFKGPACCQNAPGTPSHCYKPGENVYIERGHCFKAPFRHFYSFGAIIDKCTSLKKKQWKVALIGSPALHAYELWKVHHHCKCSCDAKGQSQGPPNSGTYGFTF